MSEWRDRLATAPLWVIFLYSAVAFAALTAVLPGPSAWSAWRAIFSGLFFGVFMTVVCAVMRRRDRVAAGVEDISRQVLVARALRTGEAPTDGSLDAALRGLVRRRRAQLRWAGAINPWLFGAAALLSVVLAVTGQPVLFFYGAFYIGLVIWLRRSAARSRSRLARLEAELDSRASN